MWALNKNVKMPTDAELKKMSVENTPKEKEDVTDAEKEATKKKRNNHVAQII